MQDGLTRCHTGTAWADIVAVRSWPDPVLLKVSRIGGQSQRQDYGDEIESA